MKKKFLNLKNTKSKKEFSIKSDKERIYIYTLDSKDEIRTISLPKKYFLKVLASN